MANMPIKRTISTHSTMNSAATHTTPAATKRDWPRLFSHLAYLCAGLSLVLVFVQLNLYCWHFNRVYNADVETAITLTNGQTYFGRLEKYGPHTLVLFDVYYLQVGASEGTTGDGSDAATDVATTDASSSLKLMKLEDDFYKPNNYLIINRDEVLYWQQLQSNSPILETIDQYNNQAQDQV